MEYLFGAKVHVIGDKVDHSEPALIIMNHRLASYIFLRMNVQNTLGLALLLERSFPSGSLATHIGEDFPERDTQVLPWSW